jgi:hypothetical protein
MNIINSEIETRRKEARTSTPPCNRRSREATWPGPHVSHGRGNQGGLSGNHAYVISQPSQQVFDFLTKATGAYPGQESCRRSLAQ